MIALLAEHQQQREKLANRPVLLSGVSRFLAILPADARTRHSQALTGAGIRMNRDWTVRRMRDFSRPLRIEVLEQRSYLAADLDSSPDVLADDSYENNDTRATAANLGILTASQTLNNLVQADANDWYRFTLASTAASSSVVSTAFTHADGDLDLELYNSAGVRLKVSQGITNSERISLGGLAAGTYFVRVYGYRGTWNPSYSLSVTLGAAQAPTDDDYENNDTQATAANLGTLIANVNLSNLKLRDSADWYRITTTANGTAANTATINFQHSQGNLALQLVSSTGTVLATANGTGNSESVSLAGRAAGTYYLRVYSATGATNPNYSLQIVAPVQTAVTTAPAGAFDIQINYAGFTASQRTIFERAAAEWEAIIVGDLPSAIYNGAIVDDLLINATSTDIDGVGGTLGQASYDRTRTTGTRLPYHGNMEFDSADLADMEADGSLLNVIVHEIGHVLGIGTLWQAKGLLIGAGTSNPTFTGRQATAAYNALFGTHASGVPVENGGGGGTRDSHWRESVFASEIMTGYIDAGINPTSRITIGSLADLGYTVNMAAADPYFPPGSASVVASSRSGSGSSARLVAGSMIAPGAITGGDERSHVVRSSAADESGHDRARNLRPAAVFAVLNELRQSSAVERISIAESGMGDCWSEEIDWLFAGEAELWL